MCKSAQPEHKIKPGLPQFLPLKKYSSCYYKSLSTFHLIVKNVFIYLELPLVRVTNPAQLIIWGPQGNRKDLQGHNKEIYKMYWLKTEFIIQNYILKTEIQI